MKEIFRQEFKHQIPLDQDRFSQLLKYCKLPEGQVYYWFEETDLINGLYSINHDTNSFIQNYPRNKLHTYIRSYLFEETLNDNFKLFIYNGVQMWSKYREERKLYMLLM